MTADQWGSAPAIEGDVWDALSQSSGPEIFKFTNVGDSITGTITEPPVIEPAREFGSNEPKTTGITAALPGRNRITLS